MLVLRILALPIALSSFAVFYTMAIKAPQVVELASLALWIVLPFFIVTAGVGRILRTEAKD